MLSESEKLNALMELGIKLNQVQDLDILMEQLLKEARRFVNADAGSIYIRKREQLHFTYTQNDTLQQRLAIGNKLMYSTFSVPVNPETIAGYVATEGRVLNISDVYQIPPTASYGFGEEFDQKVGYRTKSMLTVPLKSANDDILGVLQIINAQNESKEAIPFSELDEKMMMMFAGIASVALERAQMTRALLLRMIQMAEMRDPEETGPHVNRVGSYSIEIFEKWGLKHGLSAEEIDKKRDILRMAAMLHDVGKVAVSDKILKKRGQLTEEEYETMKRHTVRGARLFLDKNSDFGEMVSEMNHYHSDFDAMAAQVALNHHEKWDGTGYPGHVDIATGEPLKGYALPGHSQKAIGKREEEIPLVGRIVALADVYDALSTKRSYKAAWEESKVLDTIEKSAGYHFDPELVEIFFSCLPILRAIQQRYKEPEIASE